MDIRPTRTQEDYDSVMLEIESLMSAEFGTPEGDRLDVLATLAQAYEEKHFPADSPDPIEAIRFHMEQHQLTPKDLTPVIGQLNRVYEILNRTRPLTLKMIRRLHETFNIPVESLIMPTTCSVGYRILLSKA